jgi:ATP-dependent RecD-like DNA helicase SH3 domain
LPVRLIFSDFYFVQADDPETAVSRIIELVKTRIPKRFGLDPIRDIQVLCPMNRGGVGARSLNIELQAALNPAGERKVERFGWTFAPGDKVMQIENDYDKEVYNGDIGYVDDVDADAGELTASFDGRLLGYSALLPGAAPALFKSVFNDASVVARSIPIAMSDAPGVALNKMSTPLRVIFLPSVGMTVNTIEPVALLPVSPPVNVAADTVAPVTLVTTPKASPPVPGVSNEMFSLVKSAL